MSMLEQKEKIYDDGRTKQSFRDETDINKILERAQVTGTISHLEKHEGVYGDYANFDFFEQTLMLTKGREVFDDLPSEIRNEFENSPAEFFKYVNDPANKDDLINKLPGLAEPGRQNIKVKGQTALAETTKPEAKVEKTAIVDRRVAAETSLEDNTEAPIGKEAPKAG